MRKVTGILLCLLVIAVCAVALGDVPIDEEHFPDPAFRKYVRQFDTTGLCSIRPLYRKRCRKNTAEAFRSGCGMTRSSGLILFPRR